MHVDSPEGDRPFSILYPLRILNSNNIYPGPISMQLNRIYNEKNIYETIKRKGVKSFSTLIRNDLYNTGILLVLSNIKKLKSKFY